MLTVKDFQDLYRLNAEDGKGLCRGQYYLLNHTRETEDLIQADDVEGLAKRLINSYTGLLFEPLNRYLREEPPHIIKPLLEFCGIMLYKSLDYAPSFSQSVVYRNEMTSQPERLHNWFASRVGEVVEFPSFLSTYHNRDHWKQAEPNFRIETSENSNGKNIAEYLGKSGEAEVLFKSNTRFKVLAVDDMIHLQETLDEPAHVLCKDYYYTYDEDGDDEDDEEEHNQPSLSDSGLI
ncbi:MAG: hypothetical protein JWP58_247 [Hymenobacter sp.]|nr:hypothetical protein [Hymenobacter sp.]